MMSDIELTRLSLEASNSKDIWLRDGFVVYSDNFRILRSRVCIHSYQLTSPEGMISFESKPVDQDEFQIRINVKCKRFRL